ncbi:MAG: OB-fold nucleic acid binding domain-containing protein, partial [Micromonosporaceae bacterium]
MQQSVVPPGPQSVPRAKAGARTLAAELPSRIGDDVRLQGWVHRRRRLASVTFVVIRDRSGLAQVVVRDPQTVAQV